MKLFLEIIKTPFYLIGIAVLGFICLIEILEEKEKTLRKSIDEEI